MFIYFKKGLIMELASFKKSKLREFYLTAKADLHLVETNILGNKEKYEGCESSSEEHALLIQVASYAKETYNANVTPDIDGMEGFAEALKTGLKRVAELFKSKPNKEQLAVLKKNASEITAAIDLYKSSKWLDAQTFINVGHVKFNTPKLFGEVKTIDDVKKIIEEITKKYDAVFKPTLDDAWKRLSKGSSIFSKYEDKEPSEKLFKEVETLVPIAPIFKPFPKDFITSTLGGNKVTVSISALTKSDVQKVVDMMVELKKFFWEKEEAMEVLLFDLMSYEEYWDSDFWSEVPEEIMTKMESATEWRSVNETILGPLSKELGGIVMVIGRFLEDWILYSIK